MDALAAGRAALGGAVSAPAKINLALHVTGRRENGYHDLDSLVVFARDGDHLTITPADQDQLTIEGPFAAGLPLDRGNLVLRALDLARSLAARDGIDLPPVHIHLQKNLPLSSGIGGGSADAAALLRWIADANPVLADRLSAECLSLGADVPMCWGGQAARVRGIGEVSAPVARLGRFAMVLVNCGAPVSTPSAFAGLETRDNPPLPALPTDGFADLGQLVSYLRETRNDLEAPALRIVPEIAAVSRALAEEGAAFQRMSGSGATVFALFETNTNAEAAATRLRTRQPHWWVAATEMQPMEEA